MAVHYGSRGIFIKKYDRGEADQIFKIYTEDFGKLEILGKAIRKIKSKLRGGADLFYFSNIEFIQGKTYKTLTDAVLVDSFQNIRKDLERKKIAYQIADALDYLTPKEEKDEQIWQLAIDVFHKLNNWKIEELLEGHEEKLEIIYYYFYWNLVSLLGYRPELKKYSLAGKKIDSDIAKILKIIFNRNWPILSRLKVGPNHIRLLKNITEWYNKDVITGFPPTPLF